MIDFFNTTAGAASILGLILTVVYLVIDRSNRRQTRSDQVALKIELREGRERLERSIEEGNKRLERSIDEGNQRVERIIARTDETTKEILREIARNVA